MQSNNRLPFNICMPETKEVTAISPCCKSLKKHSKFKRMRGCNSSFIIENRPLIQWMAATGMSYKRRLLTKGMHASAYFKETQYSQRN